MCAQIPNRFHRWISRVEVCKTRSHVNSFQWSFCSQKKQEKRDKSTVAGFHLFFLFSRSTTVLSWKQISALTRKQIYAFRGITFFWEAQLYFSRCNFVLLMRAQFFPREAYLCLSQKQICVSYGSTTLPWKKNCACFCSPKLRENRMKTQILEK